MKFFTTPNSKNIIATLRIVAIEKSVLTFLLILYFHDKIVWLRRNFSKALVILSRFLLLFLLLFVINSIYQPCIPSWSFSKWAFSHLCRKNIWKCNISMVNMKQMVWEPRKYLKIFLVFMEGSRQDFVRRVWIFFTKNLEILTY